MDNKAIDIRAGDRIRDNDPRSSYRVLEVTGVSDTHVFARRGVLAPVRIQRRRVHTDGKPRRSGFSLITEVE